jgi:hypothetical protein
MYGLQECHVQDTTCILACYMDKHASSMEEIDDALRTDPRMVSGPLHGSKGYSSMEFTRAVPGQLQETGTMYCKGRRRM